MSLALYILGSLVEEPSNPYKLKKQLHEALPVIQMSEGKFYYNFEALQKKGFIKPVGVIEKENRPNKTLYGITQNGKQFLEEEIYNSFKNLSKVEELYTSIYLLKYVDPAKAAIFLEDNIKEEKKRWVDYKEANQNEELRKRLDSLDENQRMAVQFISDHAFDQADQNIRWMEKLLSYLKRIS